MGTGPRSRPEDRGQFWPPAASVTVKSDEPSFSQFKITLDDRDAA